MAGKKLLNRMEIKKKKRGWKTSRDRETFSQSVWKGPELGWFHCSVEQRIFFLFRSSPLIQPPPRFFSILKSQRMMSGVSALASACPFHTKKHLSPPSSIGGGKALKSRKNLFFQVRMNPPSHLRYPPPKKTDPPPSSPSSDIHYNPMYFSWPGGESMNEKPKVSIPIISTAITNAVHLNIKSWGDYRDGRDHYLQLCLCVCVWASIWM